MTEAQWDRTIRAKESLQRANGSVFQRRSLAKEYRQVAKHLFIIVEVSIYRDHGIRLDSL